jgi:hypothetical protein
MELSIFLPVLWCLAIYGFVYVFRTLLEAVQKFDLKDKVLWRSGILPVTPVLVGALSGLIPSMSFFCPAILGTAIFNHVIFGGCCGLCSGWVYTRVQDLIKNWKISTDSNTSNTSTTSTTESLLENAVNGAEEKTD